MAEFGLAQPHLVIIKIYFSSELSYFQFRPDFVVILSPLWAQICYFGLGGMPMFEPLVGSFCFGHFGSWDEF